MLPFSALYRLAKAPLCLLIGCSTIFGAVLGARGISLEVASLGIGVLLLAMGAATLNSLQEMIVDGQMARTASRPLVTAIVSPGVALIQALLLLTSGLLVLYLFSLSALPAALGFLAVVLYNGVYTPLKQVSLLSIIPGAICGAVPPLIGWIGTGGDFISFFSLLLFFLLFLWQVPHFCLVLLLHKEDYLHSRQPNFLRLLSERSIRLLSCIWIFSLALVMMLFSIAISSTHTIFLYLIVINSVAFSCMINFQLLIVTKPPYKKVFIYLNVMLSLHMLLSMFAIVGR